MNLDVSEMPAYPFPFGPFGTSTLAYDDLRATTPVCRATVPSGKLVWLILRYEDVRMVHRDPRFSREAAVRMGATLTKEGAMELERYALQNMDGGQHVQIRKVFASHFGRGHTEFWKENIHKQSLLALDGLSGRQQFDLRADFFEPVSRNSAESIFGFPLCNGPAILELFFDPGLVAGLQRRLSDLIHSEIGLPPGSYLATLREAWRAGALEEEALVANLLVLVTVTFEAVGGPFLGGVFALLREPDQWAACVEDRSLVQNAVDEMLRCYPNGDGQFLRVATEDAVLAGVKITAGDLVLAPVSAANADPDVFPEPRRFNIRRHNSNKHLAFGHGPHLCLGSMVAKCWMETALDCLLTRLPGLRLDVSPSAVTYRPMPLINIIERLPVARE